MAVKPSVQFALLLSFIHVTVGLAVCLTSVSLPVMLALLLMVILSLLYHLARDVLLVLPNSWREITLASGGQSVVTRNGSRFPFLIDNKTFVHPYFIVLHVRFERRILPVSRVIFPDELDAGEFRAMCVRLKFA